MKCILAIDQGTTGTTAALIDAKNLSFVGKANFEFPQIFPRPSWVEHNLEDIWDTVEKSVRKVLADYNVDSRDIVSIGITNQRETTCAFNSKGAPLANAIVWQDRRTQDFCKSLNSEAEEIRNKTGLPIDAYFSGTKMRWLLQNNQLVAKALADNDLKFGTIDTFLLYRLSNCKSHYTDTSNASRTLLMNLKDCDWDDDLLKTFEVPKSTLPKILNSFDKFGTTSGLSFLPDGIPITGILGDQQSALFGQSGYNEGSLKCTYGTGSFLLLNTGNTIQYSSNGLLSTVAYSYQGKHFYALEGSCYIAGAAVQWLRDNLNLFDDSPSIEAFANKIQDLSQMTNILFLPFFTGIGSPHWKSEATASIIGLTRDTNKFHLSRACLEGIALSINDLLKALEFDFGSKLESLNVDGGATSNNLLMSIQASISNIKVIRPRVIETTAYGAALAAGIGSELLSFSDIEKLWELEKSFTPSADKIETQYYQDKKNLWSKFISTYYLND